ncbi:SWI/SNF complex component snf12 [Physocladia obscura]|uniref:SWI/SNF complex component snf12 n=1 Tax=Physocladia obscura TaxID=109957 RepID=A0AAD5XFD6_9FUNG|nr:SWI/SNF complex component snf12 [Physocladia obscura]
MMMASGQIRPGQMNMFPSAAVGGMGMPMGMPGMMPMNMANMQMNMQQQQQQQQQQQHHAQASKRAAAASATASAALEAKRRRVHPMDRSLPPKIESLVPEAKLYASLQSNERKIDAAIAAKRAQLLESVVKTPKVKRTLRLYIENTASNQSSAGISGLDIDLNLDSAPSWTLKIHGVLVGANTENESNRDGAPGSLETIVSAPADEIKPAKLSALLRTVQVKLIRDASLYTDGGNTIEWRKGESPTKDFDGIEITRKGDTEVQAKISLIPDITPERYKLSAELSDVLDVHEETKTNVVMRLWQYIKMHGLQDVDDKRMINFDETLNKIFKTKKVLLTHLPDLLSTHFLPLDPVIIEYTIKLDQPRTVSPVSYEIEVEIDEPEITRKIGNVVSGGDTASLKEIALIDDEITKLVQKVTQAKHKREFMLSFAKDPVGFINSWVASQTRDLEVILGDSRINAEEARRSSFYKENWVNEAVFHYLNSV